MDEPVRGIPVEVIRKDIKTLHISVYPPHGRVRVAVPLHLDDDAVRMAILARRPWIRRQQAAFAQQERQSQRAFVTGESHSFQVRRYRLDVTERDAPPATQCLNNTRIALTVRPGTDSTAREAVLHRGYRQQCRAQVPPRLACWEPNIGDTMQSIVN